MHCSILSSVLSHSNTYMTVRVCACICNSVQRRLKKRRSLYIFPGTVHISYALKLVYRFFCALIFPYIHDCGSVPEYATQYTGRRLKNALSISSFQTHHRGRGQNRRSRRTGATGCLSKASFSSSAGSVSPV